MHYRWQLPNFYFNDPAFMKKGKNHIQLNSVLQILLLVLESSYETSALMLVEVRKTYRPATITYQ